MHPDFADRVVGFHDFVGNSRLPYDDCGHGTHVAGCLCGNGSVSQGRYRGVAPGCRVLAGKVLDDHGDGTISDMVAGIQWVLASKDLYQVRVLNISVSMGEIKDSREGEYLISCLEEVWDAGIFVTVAAGNRGPSAGSLSPLGNSRKVVTVGCHDGAAYKCKENACERYSGRGPSSTVLKKPDIVAPGTDIISCNAQFKAGYRSCKNAYVSKNGTSMSTPLVSGAVALCLEKYPAYTNEQAKRRILWSASDLGEPWGKQGWGMLNVKAALKNN